MPQYQAYSRLVASDGMNTTFIYFSVPSAVSRGGTKLSCSVCMRRPLDYYSIDGSQDPDIKSNNVLPGPWIRVLALLHNASEPLNVSTVFAHDANAGCNGGSMLVADSAIRIRLTLCFFRLNPHDIILLFTESA